ncbi:Sjogren's syndrome/scleroderma autoantigen 1 family protein [Natrialbaceae archaeon AArc-T1-2]|uniref:Sjogren's syndrome/scleroderma autoantigen 1 family protein n=1 Tax=Natrialbaceae archaeon AArc-T1-2 TaxID=3053904 RepID=UPI00255AE69A|nr:Sjogren's syndrome/scleroderma autoantigen 1 family protein [Natrialbaceae archaeon AArc-T1-2]WIV65653.1 Sjogren's syndrome/scleroderma autoantigen 1 family protein [Natrialbaceae archaeon AArc-T1-2]
MSDFDKEAEREKLREKYERDRQDREATKRMSDLLLKGATMTNAHCDVCGDPLFQQNGTTFCPSCHGGPEGVEATAADEGGTDAATTDATATAEPTPVDESSTDEAPAGADAETTATDDATADRESADDTDSSDRDQPAARSRSETPATDRATRPARTPASRADDGREAARRPSREDRPARTRPPSRVDGSDLETARSSLVTALEHFAGEAAATENPRYARECLEAAREAADALAALDQQV